MPIPRLNAEDTIESVTSRLGLGFLKVSTAMMSNELLSFCISTEASGSSVNVFVENGYTVIELGKRSKGHPLAMYFVYASELNLAGKPKDTKYIIKGNSDLCSLAMERIPVCLYRYTFWQNGEDRGSWRIKTKYGLCLHSRVDMGARAFDKYVTQLVKSKSKFSAVNVPRHANFVLHSFTMVSPVFFYRNLPHRFIPEWNSL